MGDDYIDELSRIQARINSLFEQVLTGAGFGGGEPDLPGSWSPEVDVLETADAYMLFAELPGVAREDIDLEVRDGRLAISGRRRPPRSEGRYTRMERSHGPFRRDFALDKSVDPDGIEATFRLGVLEIVVPKARGDRSTRVAVSEEE